MSEQQHPGLHLEEATPASSKDAEEPLFGFWVFLMSDAVIFALLFATYGVMLPGTAGGPGPADVFELKSAAIQTAILLASSFTYGLASLALKYEHRRRDLVPWLLVTLALGLTFLGFELSDFAKMAAAGAVPQRSGFLSAFFALVPTHGLHVASGCLWIVVMLGQIRVHGVDDRTKLNLLRLGLFWHFLDIVWVGIFSVVYLQGLA